MQLEQLSVRTLVDQLPQAMVIADDGNQIVFVNSAAEVLLDYTRNALVGQPLTVIIPERLREVHLAGFERHVVTGERRLLGQGPVHVPARRRDGSEVEVELTLHAHEENGRKLFTAALVDRSRQIELQREQALNRALTAARSIELRLAVAPDLTSVEQALPIVLEVAASTLEWDVAIGWLVEGAQLVPGPVWFAPGAGPAASSMAARRFVRGEGLPGRVWDTGTPASLTDLTAAESFPRAEVAQRYGLTAGFAIPISIAGEVRAVAEFFRVRPMSIESASLVALGSAGQYIGVLLERTAAIKRAEASEVQAASVTAAALDCIIGVDSRGLITSFNPAAEQILGWTAQQAIGQPLAELLIPEQHRASHYAAFAKYVATRSGRILGQRLELPVLRSDGVPFPAELTITAADTGGALSFTGFIRDMTEQKRAEEQARASSDRLAHIADTLQQSLLPADLPVITGVSLSARFRPAGDGDEIGGDFYDVFEYADNRWCLVIGDVCGKGADAAVLTALSRYTLRAAALEGQAPAQMLQLLNQAVMAQSSERFVTACVIVLEPRGTGWVGATSAAGGHPVPMVRRSTRIIERIPVSGPLIGAFSDVTFPELTFELGYGDALVLYTDGVTEARIDGKFLDDDGLAALLQTSEALDSGSLADSIHDAVMKGCAGASRDDVAILVATVTGR